SPISFTTLISLSSIILFFTFFFFFFNDPATTEIYTLSLHDALPISIGSKPRAAQAGYRWFTDVRRALWRACLHPDVLSGARRTRSEEHTSELQSRENLVCRLLLEKKKKKTNKYNKIIDIKLQDDIYI